MLEVFLIFDKNCPQECNKRKMTVYWASTMLFHVGLPVGILEISKKQSCQLLCLRINRRGESPKSLLLGFQILFDHWEGLPVSCFFQSTISCTQHQDIDVKPLQSFFKDGWTEFNRLNRTPMESWLDKETEETYRARLKALGNIVVPAGGALGFEILFHIRKRSF